jgi:mono/diheme cytochrome c family protein
MLGLAAMVVLAVAGIYAASEWLLRRRHDLPLPPVATPPAPADSTEGRRIAILVGCLEGCHGREGEGGVERAEGIFRATAPTLSDVLPRYSDPELVRLVRFGVKRDGRAALGMPSATFYPLGDADLARVIGYLRQRPVVPPRPRSREVQPLGRLALVLGKWHTSADAVDPTRPRWGELPRTTPHARGRYLASVICSECHGLDLQGDAFMRSPSLTVVGGYSLDQFRHLMRTGEPIGGRDLGLMRVVATRAFAHFTDDEVSDLHAYLRDLALPAAHRGGAGAGHR